MRRIPLWLYMCEVQSTIHEILQYTTWFNNVLHISVSPSPSPASTHTHMHTHTPYELPIFLAPTPPNPTPPRKKREIKRKTNNDHGISFPVLCFLPHLPQISAEIMILKRRKTADETDSWFWRIWQQLSCLPPHLPCSTRCAVSRSFHHFVVVGVGKICDDEFCCVSRTTLFWFHKTSMRPQC